MYPAWLSVWNWSRCFDRMNKFFGCLSSHIQMIQTVLSWQAGDVMKYPSPADAVVIYVERYLLSRSTIGYEHIHFWFDLTRADVIQLESVPCEAMPGLFWCPYFWVWLELMRKWSKTNHVSVNCHQELAETRHRCKLSEVLTSCAFCCDPRSALIFHFR